MIRTIRTSVFATLILFLAAGSANAQDVITIQEARDKGADSTVTVEGTVTRAMGDFTYFQDGTAGLTIRQTSGDFADDVEGDTITAGVKIRVTGTLSEFRQLLQINGSDLDSYSILDTLETPAPQSVTLQDIADNGEAHEAELIEITDLQTDSTGTFEASTNYHVSGPTGTGLLRTPNSGDTEIDGALIPSDAFRFTGILGQFSFDDPASGYQLAPIQEGDVQATAGGEDILTIADARAKGADSTVTVEGTVTRSMGDFTYFQDATAGLTIRQTFGDFSDDVAGDTITAGVKIRVTGTLSEFRELLQINGSDLESYTILDTLDVPAAQSVTLEDIENDGESYEAELVEVRILETDSTGTFEEASTYVVSGETGSGELRIPNAGDSEVDGTAIPEELFTFTGVIGQFSFDDPADGYQMLAIDSGDVSAFEPMTIAEARAAGSGETVTVEGIATRAMGDFTYIQDGTAGLTIRQTEGAFHADVAGDTITAGVQIRVTGTLSDFRQLLQINEGDLQTYSILDTLEVPTPQSVTLQEVAENGEEYEAELVEVTGLQTDSTGTFEEATSYAVEQATTSGVVRIPNAGDSNVDGTEMPEDFFMFTGVVGQFSFDDPADGYQLLAIAEGDIEGMTIGDTDETVPYKFALNQNYPNPFGSSTTIDYELPERAHVTLSVFNVLGQQVKVLVDEQKAPGPHQTALESGTLASGVYFYRIEAGDNVKTRRMVLVK